MKKILIFLFVVFTTVALFAQTGIYRPFPTDSALWSYGNFDMASFYRTCAYKVKGDTTINSVTYSKLYTIKTFSYDNDSGAVLHALLRINNTQSKVWLKYVDYNLFRDTTEFLLYDFSLQVNDTFYARRIVYDSLSIVTDTLIVERKYSIYSINDSLNLTQLRKLRHNAYYNFVEKIGSDQLLLYPERDIAAFPFEGHLIQQFISCFKQGETVYYQSNQCILNYYITGAHELTANHQNLLYPTFFQSGQPVHFKLKYESELPIETLTICNARGEQVEHLVLMHNQEEIIAQKHYAQGIYIVNLKYKNGLNEYLKIVIF
ncbi:MAG: hypothetical protein KBB37_02950 [Bacteroidia bacterium]|nr:hypothetical protein [Bacteroidia bacterium]MBP7260221.1 hypothetical protein [Bacteroidia bacterium]MBP9179814.1 hypothetical protein [Bacteroidia bacterium]MBP9723813.1 hypothetical protein [Bacteroidia bacterium]